ncbi:MAG: MMPL family transporter [Solirubrobacterales bacterium]
MRQKQGLAARAGRWSARHRLAAISGWIAFVVLATFAGGAIGTQMQTDAEAGSGESGAADRALTAAFPQRSAETVLVQSESLKAGSAEFRAQVNEVEQALAATENVKRVRDPYADPQGAIAADGGSVLVEFELQLPAGRKAAQEADTAALVTPSLETVTTLDAESPEFRIEQFGGASADKQLSESFENDFKKAEFTSLPITLIILIIAFGALVAAFVPVLLAATAVIATLGLLAPISQIWPADDAIGSVVLLIGLAVGVDYSMFYLRREREERAAGRDSGAALEAAAETSGRAVLASGLTVIIAMAGMYLSGNPIFISFATGTILVVAVAVLGSLTVLPAVLATLGDRVDRGRIPFLRSPRERAGREPRGWSAILNRVLRRPLLWGGLAASALVVMAIPVTGLKLSIPGVETLPRNLAVVQTYDRIEEAFPGNGLPAEVVVETGDAQRTDVREALSGFKTRTAERPELFPGPVAVDRSPDGSVLSASVPLAGDGSDRRSEAAVDALRGEIVPATFGALDGVEANVTGFTAGNADFSTVMEQRMPIVMAFVLAFAFMLLLVTFRSIVIAGKAIILNLLSVGAAYGVVVWIFQQGHLESLLGFQSNGAIASWLPMFLFVVLFGLSMDYHVFIISRIREAHESGLSTSDAVAEGIKSTAGVVTAAAIVMVAIFSIFATLSSLEFKQFGVGLGVAILIDATIVRGVLLPASMKLLGRWNWYLPRSLEWLPRTGAEAGPQDPQAGAISTVEEPQPLEA